MSEERFEITWTSEKTELMTRRDIAAGAQVGLGAFGAACREWLKANPKRGLTREEFDKLPDGTILRRPNRREYIKIGTRLAYQNFENYSIVLATLIDPADMTVVSIPEPPSLDSVRWVPDKYIDVWKRLGNDTWLSLDDGSEASTAELLNQYGPIAPLIRGPQIGGES